MKRLTLVAILLMAIPALVATAADVSPRLENAIAAGDEGPVQEDGTFAIWVYFTDKDLQDIPAALAQARASLSEKALERRARVTPAGKSSVDLRDVPVAQSYIDAVAATGAHSRKKSNWINAASFNATIEQIEAISRLPFVKNIDLLAQFTRPVIEPEPGALEKAQARAEEARLQSGDRWTLDYGATLATLEQINVPPAHELGLSGEGVIIGQLDAGYVLTHVSLQHIPILATWDFVHDDDTVTPEDGDHEWQHRHGSQVLSVYAGYAAGDLVGPAYGASVILAMTEDTGSETPIEEDNWVAGLEWVESLGADMVTSSLGYFYWYNLEDMDGQTCVTTVAGDMAVERGMPVFTSAGNERGNADWGTLTAPADGDSILAMAAVDVYGNLASFSSPGPTYDGRIKPDLAAQGYNNFAASWYVDEYYMLVDGTSFACPLVAGVGALMLERIPTITPMQMAEAFRQTASNTSNPNNDIGWGIIDAFAAVTYWGAVIDHQPLTDTEDPVGPYTLTATITSRTGLDPAGQFIYWRVDGGEWTKDPLTHDGGDTYSGTIPGVAMGGQVEYYLESGDDQGIVIQAPHRGYDQPWSFHVGVDSTPPILTHYSLIDQLPAAWPPVVSAIVTDNLAVAQVELEFSVNGGAMQGPFPMTMVGENYELDFPLAPSEVSLGDHIAYTITALDGATTPNATTSGPWDVYLVESLGRILVIDDSEFRSAAGYDGEIPPDGVPQSDKDDRTQGTDRAQWLTEAGYTTEVILPADITGESLQGFDAVFLTADDNQFPVGFPLMRANLVEWVNQGHPILVEGGSVADVAFSYGVNDSTFYNTVLRSEVYRGSWVGPMTPSTGLDQHPLLVRPHVLAMPVDQDLSSNPYGDSTSDVVVPLDDSVLLLRSIYNSSVAGVVTYDNNTAPEAGQVVYYSFAMSYLEEEVGRGLVENAMAYLLAREAPGEASISGTVTLFDSDDPSGVAITCSGGQTAVTGPGGQYTVTGLHGSTYTITASKDGYGPASSVVELGPTDAVTGVDLTLYPIVEVAYTAEPGESIPDFDVDGLSSVITVTEDGLVNNLNIDINIEHPSVGQLVVSLTSPSGTTVTLHNQTGATADNIIGNWPNNLLVDGPGTLEDFLAEPTLGDWTLKVADLQFGAWGTFHSWGLNLAISPDIITPVQDGLPQATRLLGNVPNPFNPQTTIMFETSQTGQVVLTIHDVRGHKVAELLRENMPAGHHQLTWNGRDATGRSVASGLYFARLQAGGVQELMKMMLVR